MTGPRARRCRALRGGGVGTPSFIAGALGRAGAGRLRLSRRLVTHSSQSTGWQLKMSFVKDAVISGRSKRVHDQKSRALVLNESQGGC